MSYQTAEGSRLGIEESTGSWGSSSPSVATGAGHSAGRDQLWVRTGERLLGDSP